MEASKWVGLKSTRGTSWRRDTEKVASTSAFGQRANGSKSDKEKWFLPLNHLPPL